MVMRVLAQSASRLAPRQRSSGSRYFGGFADVVDDERRDPVAQSEVGDAIESRLDFVVAVLLAAVEAGPRVDDEHVDVVLIDGRFDATVEHGVVPLVGHGGAVVRRRAPSLDRADPGPVERLEDVDGPSNVGGAGHVLPPLVGGPLVELAVQEQNVASPDDLERSEPLALALVEEESEVAAGHRLADAAQRCHHCPLTSTDEPGDELIGRRRRRREDIGNRANREQPSRRRVAADELEERGRLPLRCSLGDLEQFDEGAARLDPVAEVALLGNSWHGVDDFDDRDDVGEQRCAAVRGLAAVVVVVGDDDHLDDATEPFDHLRGERSGPTAEHRGRRVVVAAGDESVSVVFAPLALDEDDCAAVAGDTVDVGLAVQHSNGPSPSSAVGPRIFPS